MYDFKLRGGFLIMEIMDVKELINLAIDARKKAYTPYSRYKVGAALLTSDGKIYQGCNIESAAYSVTTCAERTALLQAVFNESNSFKAICVVGGNENETDSFKDYAPPCGVCRQYLREFCDPRDMQVILAKSVDDYEIFTLEELLPLSFGPDHLA